MILSRLHMLALAPCLGVSIAACQGMFEERPPSEPCEGVTCSDHGACWENGEEAECRCDPGYEPDGLECREAAADGDSDIDADSDGDIDADSDTDVDGDVDSDVDSDADADEGGTCGFLGCAEVFSNCDCKFLCIRADETCGDVDSDGFLDLCDDCERSCPWEPGMSPPPTDLLPRGGCVCQHGSCFDASAYCESDEDCVPEHCCRPTECVAREHRDCRTHVCCECEDCRPCITGCSCVGNQCRTAYDDGCC